MTNFSESNINEVLHDISGVLSYHQSSSLTQYHAKDKLESFFALKRCPLSEVPDVISSPIKENNGVETLTDAKSDHARLAEIAKEVVLCKSCALGEQRSAVTAGTFGSKRIRLFIIGHWLITSGTVDPDTVFGREADQMLTRMLTAINLTADEVCITNVIKCGVDSDTHPKVEHINCCASHLQRQISAAAPDIICTMGTVATKSLLQKTQPLSRLRGRFHNYEMADGSVRPLLATYHPEYLLQNHEMKNATWADLQAIQKRLEKG